MLTKFTIGVTALLLGAAAIASDPGQWERADYYERRGPMPFEVYDLNQDGVITAEEHAKARSERQEARAGMGYPVRNARFAPSFEQIDVDGSGSIDKAELSAHQSRCMQQKYPGRGGRWMQQP